jgi:outer membrane lipoprotein LolB
MSRHCFLIFPLLALAGCATLPPPPPPADWNTVKLERQALQLWEVSGRTAIVAANDGWTASMEWKQKAAVSEIRLFGPFGAGALRVTTDGESLQIETSRGETLSGEDARAMLEHTLGASLPLRPMRFWLLGVPEPESAALAQLDEQGRLAELNQAGWRVAYDRYEYRDGHWLPAQLSAEQVGAPVTVKVKVAISRWQLGQ